MPIDTLAPAAGVDAQLAVVERKAPLDLDLVDYTIARPAELAAHLDDPLRYAQRVEIIVTGLGIERLLPRHDVRIERFLEIWTEDETTHGAALGALLTELGLPTYEPTDGSLPLHNHAARLLGRLSERAHRVVELVWSASGAMNEHLAMTAYREMGTVAERLGERSLHETLFKRLRTHEAAHKGFYAAYAREVARGMHRWQRRLARAIVVQTYAPVGAGAPADKPAFGRTVRALDPDGGWCRTIGEPVQRIAEKLLADGEPLPPFVRDALAECVESAAQVRRSPSAGRAPAAAGGRRSGWPTTSAAR